VRLVIFSTYSLRKIRAFREQGLQVHELPQRIRCGTSLEMPPGGATGLLEHQGYLCTQSHHGGFITSNGGSYLKTEIPCSLQKEGTECACFL
jgi:hypothetical protein